MAPSSMLEVAPTSIRSSSQKGMRTQHPSVSRSRRDTPSVGANSPLTSRMTNGPICPIALKNSADPKSQQYSVASELASASMIQYAHSD
jgi:hypothetical protein